MPDPRFARLKTDPRFRRPKKHASKVVVDERFKAVFLDSNSKGKRPQLVDKYGRRLAKNHEQENLRRFYKLEDGSDKKPGEESRSLPDYARGEVVLESSDEDGSGSGAEVDDDDDDDSDAGGIITIGIDDNSADDEEAEIDLDESHIADLDAQVAAYAEANTEAELESGLRTRRLAVVNLDWDHVRASHLYKIFSSILCPTASALSTPTSRRTKRKGAFSVAAGQVLSVRVYPSNFGKERMAREEQEGPPPEIFRGHKALEPGQVNEETIHEVGDGEEYNEDALRKYQLARLRYYYAIVTCDTVEAAAHIYDQLEGTELERSANVFDLSFVPDNMTFELEARDEATEEVNMNFKAVDFVTDALRHSKVKLTWDDDDPERNLVTRRPFSQKELEEADFRAYLASSDEEFGPEDPPPGTLSGHSVPRNKLRALLLADKDSSSTEARSTFDADHDIDMEITFTPGLNNAKGGQEETTLAKYQRKVKEKKRKRKEELKERIIVNAEQRTDGFFGDESDDHDEPTDNLTKSKRKGEHQQCERRRNVSTVEELSLLAVSDHPDAEPEHFNMKSVVKAEKGRMGKKRKLDVENALQKDFTIDVQDERFNALHEDHTFAIDPSNPQFRQTKNMAALLKERSRRHKLELGEDESKSQKSHHDDSSLQVMIDRVKRKSMSENHKTQRRK